MTSPIDNHAPKRNGWDEAEETMNTVFEEAKNLKLADVFAKLVRKTYEDSQNCL